MQWRLFFLQCFLFSLILIGVAGPHVVQASDTAGTVSPGDQVRMSVCQTPGRYVGTTLENPTNCRFVTGTYQTDTTGASVIVGPDNQIYTEICPNAPTNTSGSSMTSQSGCSYQNTNTTYTSSITDGGMLTGGGGTSTLGGSVNNDTLVSGLVPACPAGDPSCAESTPYGPDNYGACEVASLANNIFSFIIGLGATIATLVFVYAGFLLVTSQGNVGQIGRAKTLFTNVAIGIVLLLSAGLIVNTIMSVLLGSSSPLLNWDQIPCSYSYKAGQPSQVSLNFGPNANNLQMSDSAYQSIVSNIDPNLLNASAGSCSDGTIGRVWGNLASQANCIITHESACGASPISRTDYSHVDGNPFSFGAMQINTTVHRVTGCSDLGISDLNCADAWSGTNYSAHVVNPSLYEACRAALLNPECNMRNGLRIYREAGNSWRPWSTASTCHLR